MKSVRLNIGSGDASDLLEDWVNVDVVDGPGVDVIANCTRLPYEDETVDAIRSSHMIEHLTKPELARYAAECFRVLKPGGTVETIAPAMDRLVETYWECKDQDSIEVMDFPISPLDWLDNLLFSRHLHLTDFHRQGIYPEKLRRVFSRFTLHQIQPQDRPHSKWEIRMSCAKSETPTCSICMSTRNKSKYLRRTLQSIVNQVVPFPYEIIVADDGSTDDTREVCREFGVRYYYLENARYRNPSIARNVSYRAAHSDIILAQSDDIVHVSPNTIEFMATALRAEEFLLAKTDNYKYGENGPEQYIAHYCGPETRRPFFFLGSLFREYIYAIGGYDEEFVEPCFDDNWFADCLMKGIGLKPRYTSEVMVHHQSHGYEARSHVRENKSRQLYARKTREARGKKQTKKGGTTGTNGYISSGGAWTERVDPPKITRMPKEEETETQEEVNTDPEIAQVPQEVSVNPPVIHRFQPQANRKSGRHEIPAQKMPQQGRIPSKMHFFWVGEQLSWLRYMTLLSFRCFNPSWQMTLHKMEGPVRNKGWKSSETQDTQVYRGLDHTNLLPDLGIDIVPWESPISDTAAAHACDLCQWQTLSTDGGFFSDMDILWLQPFPYDTVKDDDAVFCLSTGFMAIGLCGSVPRSSLFNAILGMAETNYSPDKYQSTGAEAIYRLGKVWPNWGAFDQPGILALQEIANQFPDHSILTLPQETIYPFNYRETHKIFGEIHSVPDDCIGIHWFGGSNTSQDWNQVATEENYETYENTYAVCAAKVVKKWNAQFA